MSAVVARIGATSNRFTASGLPVRAWRTDQVAEMLGGISTDAVLDLHHRGVLGYIRAGKRYLTPVEELDRYLADMTRTGT